MEILDEEQEKIAQIFFPHIRERQLEAQTKNTRFVHYTSAEAAMNIIQKKSFWMRESSCMNDVSEVQHGLNCLANAYKFTSHGQRFKDLLNNAFLDISDEIVKLFDSWQPHLKSETYLGCVSEHNDDEDVYGRLSMWRAYSNTSGIALIFNPKPFFLETDALKVYTNPVDYLNQQGFEKRFASITDNIQREMDFIKTLEREKVCNIVFHLFRFSGLCVKHPGFQEEKEWRLIYSPTLDSSEYMKKTIQPINGVPQVIYPIPLANIAEEGLHGIEIPEILNRVIIGPTKYPLAMYKAFLHLLNEAGVQDAEQKISISDIPLRV